MSKKNPLAHSVTLKFSTVRFDSSDIACELIYRSIGIF